MAERIKVGIIYNDNENWVGGSYYIQNLVAALNTLEDELQPAIVVFTETAKEYNQIQQTGYPYLEHRALIYISIKLTLQKRIINRIAYTFNKYVIFPQTNRLKDADDIDVIFPTAPGLVVNSGQKKIYWIPDFQELHYPQFFSAQNIHSRRQGYLFIKRTYDAVVFSSKSALEDFKRFFPNHTCKTFVLPFAVTHPVLGQYDLQALKIKYGLNNNFYIAPNQFWVHKNQKVIIEAAGILQKSNNLDFQIAFTGKEYDFRNPEYASSLKKLTNDFGLQNDIKFLGFIDRIDQLQLMKASIGVIQPSLFEGWSTVIEDGKALNKFIIASDLPVHREQLNKNAIFFNPLNPNELASLMLSAKDHHAVPINYIDSIKNYATQFINVINKL